jgi:hypothetical protein
MTDSSFPTTDRVEDRFQARVPAVRGPRRPVLGRLIAAVTRSCLGPRRARERGRAAQQIGQRRPRDQIVSLCLGSGRIGGSRPPTRESRAGTRSRCRCGWRGRGARPGTGCGGGFAPWPGGRPGSRWRSPVPTRSPRVDRDRRARPRGRARGRGGHARRPPARPVPKRRSRVRLEEQLVRLLPLPARHSIACPCEEGLAGRFIARRYEGRRLVAHATPAVIVTTETSRSVAIVVAPDRISSAGRASR